MAEHTAHASRLHALFAVAEEEILKLDEDGDGRISTHEVAGLIKRLLLRLELPWFIRAFVHRRLITLALEKALSFGPVAKKEQEDLLIQQSAHLPSISRMAFVDEEARESLEIREVLNIRPAAVDAPEDDQEGALEIQLARQEELLKMLRERKKE